MKNLARLLGLSSAPPEIVPPAKDETIAVNYIDGMQDNNIDDAENVQQIKITDIIPNRYQPRNHD